MINFRNKQNKLHQPTFFQSFISGFKRYAKPQINNSKNAAVQSVKFLNHPMGKSMKFREIIFSVFAMPLSGAVLASNAENVTITKFGTGPIYESLCGVSCVPIKVRPQHSNYAGCSQNIASWDFALDTSTESGKQAYAHLLASHMSGKTISIYGKGSCIGGSGYEAINFLVTK